MVGADHREPVFPVSHANDSGFDLKSQWESLECSEQRKGIPLHLNKIALAAA